MTNTVRRLSIRTATACLTLTVLTALAALTGCASSPPEAGARTLVIDGVAVIVAPLTAGTWTAQTQDRTTSLPQTTDGTAQLRRAIEGASGCRVTDSDYVEGGRQFDAQLDCKSGNR